MFSRRTRWDLGTDPLAAELAQRRAANLPVLDLTASNPTTAGFQFPADEIATALADGARQAYAPEPFGLPAARAAVCAYYGHSHGVQVQPERVVLASGTSELYSYVFRLLCDPGDNVLFARPSYPLFDYLAALDSVELRPYGLVYESGWHLDRAAIEAACDARTRAVAVIHPNNPTGHFPTAADRSWLAEFCAARALALIVDEVFLDYPLEIVDGNMDQASFLAEQSPCLMCVLSGLSKVSALPQMKLAWMVLSGPEALVAQASQRLEVIADSFLSSGTPVQHAAAALLHVRAELQPQILRRLRANKDFLDAVLQVHPSVQRLRIEGGWYAILRFPALRSADELALELLRLDGVHIHPGGFFGFPEAGFAVVSLLTPEPEWQSGIPATVERLA